VGYITKALRMAREDRYLTLLERMYDQSNDATQQMVQTLEGVSRYLAVSIPLTPNLRDGFLKVADFAEEISDGVPAVEKETSPEPVVSE
jgi:hypothetical protein